jgi:hypothetical protein
VKQGAVAQTALITLAVPSLFNDILCKYCLREFDLLIRKVSPAPLDGVPSGIKRSNEDADAGVRDQSVPRPFWIAAEPAQ